MIHLNVITTKKLLSLGFMFLGLLISSSCRDCGPRQVLGNENLYSSGNLRILLEPVWIRLGDEYGQLDEERGAASVDVAEFSNNSKYIASGASYGFDLSVWDTKSGALMMHEQFENQIESVCFSPGDEHLLIGGKFNHLDIYNTTDWTKFDQIRLDSSIEFLRFSNDGEILAIGHMDGTISIMDASDYTLLKKLIHTPREVIKDLPLEGRADVNSIDFSPDGNYFISGGFDGKIKVWELSSLENILSLEGHNASIKSVRISPMQNCIASASVSQQGRDDNSIKLWDFETGNLIHTLSFPLGMEAVDFSPDGKILACGGREGVRPDSMKAEQGNLYFYSIPADPVNQPISQIHKEPVFRSEYLDFNNEGNMLVSSHEDGTLRLWKIKCNGK